MSESRRTAACAVVVTFGLVSAGDIARADEADVVLKDAPGRETVQANCLSCHSADYIVMNSTFLDEKGWRASVAKMISVMGASIEREQADEIIRYLAANYAAAAR